jgi:hypothetical protein
MSLKLRYFAVLSGESSGFEALARAQGSWFMVLLFRV